MNQYFNDLSKKCQLKHVLPSIYCCLRPTGSGASFFTNFCCMKLCATFYIAFACALWRFYLSFLKHYVAHFLTSFKRITDSDLVLEPKVWF